MPHLYVSASSKLEIKRAQEDMLRLINHSDNHEAFT